MKPVQPVETLRALRELVDTVPGSRLELPDGTWMWLHTQAQIGDWLDDLIYRLGNWTVEGIPPLDLNPDFFDGRDRSNDPEGDDE